MSKFVASAVLLCLLALFWTRDAQNETPRRVEEEVRAARSELELAAREITLLEKRYQAAQTQLDRERYSNVPNMCEARITLTSSIPLDAPSSGATVYLSNMKGVNLSLYSGGRWRTYKYTQNLSLSVASTSDGIYDVFAYDNAGTVALELSAAWASTTSRTDAINLQDGAWVKSADAKRRYMGSVQVVTNSITNSYSNRGVFNACSRQRRILSNTYTTDTWTYSGSSWRSMNNASALVVQVLIGLNDTYVRLRGHGVADSTAAAVAFGIAFGPDTSSIFSGQLFGGITNTDHGVVGDVDYAGYPGIGFRSFYLNEITDGSNTVTFWGDNGTTRVQAGIDGWVET